MSHTEYLAAINAKIDVILQRLAQLEERMTRQEAL